MKNFSLLLTILILTITFNSCKKEYDSPPPKFIEVGDTITISHLRQMYLDSVINFPGTPEYGRRNFYTFNRDISLYAVVTADEKSGNLYKNVYLKDNTGAMNIALIYSGGLYQGDSIRLNLKGTTLTNSNGMTIIDSVNVDNMVTKQSNLVNVTPISVTLAELDISYEAKLVKISGVEVVGSYLGGTWADAVGKASLNVGITDCDGNQMLVRTSGYSLFAGETVPSGHGSITAIVGIYGSTLQLYIRKTSEVDMTGPRCSPLIIKDFEDQSITSGGWVTYNKTGAQFWSLSNFGNEILVMTGSVKENGVYVDYENEDWFISPKIAIGTGKTATLTFETATRYSGNILQVMLSTNFNGGDPGSATWTNLQANLSPSTGNFEWTPSGDVDLSQYVSDNVRVAFKYTSTTSAAATWELNDIKINIQ